MIDLHCHMLPDVDDGSASEADSLEMGRIAARSGVTAIALTPHCNLPDGQGNYYDGALETRFRRLAMRFRQEGLPVTLYRGMEVFSTPELPRLLDEERLLTLGGSRYLLVEFAFGETPWFAAQTLESIAVRGLTPVVAHPERYYFIQDDPRRLLRWAESGYVLQLNRGSLSGMFGRHAAKAAQWCLANGCVHLFASDAHSPYRRTPQLDDLFDHIARAASPEAAALLLERNPAAILENRAVHPLMEDF